MIKKVINIFEWLVFLLLVAVLFAVASPLLPTKTIISSYSVLTGSMEPAIPSGSLVVTRGVEASEISAGDVITFTSPANRNATIVHRVEEVVTEGGQTYFITKGDNNNATDNWRVTPDLVEGRVFYNFPGVGSFIESLKSIRGFLIGIGIPAILLAIIQIKRIKEGIDDEVRRRTQKALESKESKTNPRVSASSSSLPRGIVASVWILLLIGMFVPRAVALFSAQVQVTNTSVLIASISTPVLDFYKIDDKYTVGFRLTDVDDFELIEYELEYERDGDDGRVTEMITGVIENDQGDNEVVSPEIILGTCSGDDCVYHDGIELVILRVILHDEDRVVELSDELILDDDQGQDPSIPAIPDECSLIADQIENVIIGTTGDDNLDGTSKSDLIFGMGGNDKIDGGGGNDCIVALDGDDHVEGGSGSDVIILGNGNNFADGGSGDDTIYAGSGNDTIEGGSGSDKIFAGEGNNHVDGGSNDDEITGSERGQTYADGGSGNDVCQLVQEAKSCEMVF